MRYKATEDGLVLAMKEPSYPYDWFDTPEEAIESMREELIERRDEYKAELHDAEIQIIAFDRSKHNVIQV